MATRVDPVMDDDSALVALLRRGDGAALDQVYRTYSARLWSFLARLCGNDADAADVFQETWVAVARHARALRPDTRLLPWLFTVARNQHISLKRRWWSEARRRVGLGLEPPAHSVQPDEPAALKVASDAVASAFGLLAADHREVLLLCVVEEMSAAEVAVVLGLREDAVRKRLGRARAELEARLGRAKARRRNA